jgi:ribonucleoside-diphosphate reductase alpha chain
MDLTSNAKIILNRFLLKNKDGKIIESQKGLWTRIAKNIAKEDIKYGRDREEVKKIEKEFFKMMDDGDFLPSLPVVANAGRKLQQLAACFVLPVEDDIESIFEAVKEMALIQKTGGGTGFSFSRLRPEGSYVSETGGIASGPVSFMKVFDAATGAIKEGGIRRGANMGTLEVDHPDIEKFIGAKEKNELSNFNISVLLNEKFMDCVIKDKDFKLAFNKKVYKTIRAKDLFSSIAKHAWINGDPGILFIDEINKHNPTPKIKIETTNPCGEQPLLPYESCILGSINLSNFVKDKRIDFKKLENTVKKAVHFLDNSIDASSYPIKKIEERVKQNRKIGLGVMGFADLLIRLNIPYDSPKAEKVAYELMRFIEKNAIKYSQEIAKIKGDFPNIKNSIFKDQTRRNATLTTIAPTGTIAIIADTSEGIEPIFSPAYMRYSTYGKMIEINPRFRDIIKKYKIDSRTLNKIASEGTLQNTELPKEIKNIFKTAHDISPEWHLRIQAAFQKSTDNAVSKTVNLRSEVTPKEIENIFLLAHRLRCKGLTVYRYNSRKEQVLSFCEKCELD